jgi:hypothetical protein
MPQRSAAQKGQKPAPMKKTSDLPLGLFSGSLVTCMNFPRTFFGMKLLTDRNPWRLSFECSEKVSSGSVSLADMAQRLR